MVFDPKKARDSGGDNRGVPAHDYLVAIVWMERRTSKAGKPYERCKYEIISGACKAKTFYDQVGLDVSNEGTAFRLGLLLGELNGDRPIDLDNDDEVRAALMFKPFKASVNRRTENGYVNNGVAKILVGDKVSEVEREAMEQWKIDRDAAREFEGGEELDPLPEDDAPHAATAGDDIPF